MVSERRVSGGGNDRPDASRATDELFGVLASPARRAILVTLDQWDRPVELDTLASSVTAAGDLTPGDARVTLHHQHLPKLADAGYVRYGEVRDAGTDDRPGSAEYVELTDDADDALALLDAVGTDLSD